MQIAKKKTGPVCCSKGCNNKSYNSTEHFYTFPIDPERAKIWLLACGREDLLYKVGTLHKSHRLCGKYFEEHMFQRTKKRKLLRRDSVPTLFPDLQLSPTERSTCSQSVTPVPLDISVPSTSTAACVQTSPLRSPTVYIQTEQTLTSHSPRKEKLKYLVKKVKEENKNLKKENQDLLKKYTELKFRLENIPSHISLQQYQELTYKFCSSAEIAEWINVQIAEIQKAPQGRRWCVRRT